ncbi:MAG: biotin transporter BioY [Acidobacteria bacterium]|nr:MAG: biotin transporter BioY [Acidobacteriota bacterium]PYY04976.1 MAG: biotin transporter BioY [Acidobacteriota bacterium]PYY21283.1 MAG: biotin transporter BioY [Acidobacteriota bacterium]
MAQALAGQTNQVESFAKVRAIDAALVIGGSLLMAACGHISIPLWFTPVPITLQTFGLMFLALTLGAWRSAAALLLYLVEGASGLPVFSPHGPGGLLQLFGPTGGYLISYPFAALVAGLIADKLSLRSRVVAFSLGAVACSIVVFTAGAFWLAVVSHKPASTVLALAVVPFLPGEVLKSVAAVGAAIGVTARGKAPA